MRTRNIIVIEKEGKLYAFSSIKKLAEVFKDVNPLSIYKMHPNKSKFKYKSYIIHRLSLY